MAWPRRPTPVPIVVPTVDQEICRGDQEQYECYVEAEAAECVEVRDRREHKHGRNPENSSPWSKDESKKDDSARHRYAKKSLLHTLEISDAFVSDVPYRGESPLV